MNLLSAVAIAIIRRARRPSRLVKAAAVVLLLCLVEALFHAHIHSIPRPPQDLDGPFARQCQDPRVAAKQPREKAAFVMLARNLEIDEARETIKNIETQFNQWFNYPVIFLNNEPWDPEFVRELNASVSGNAIFELIPSEDWSYPPHIKQQEAQQSLARQALSGVWNGGKESYHHMCRFYSGTFYTLPALKPYKWYWRLEPGVRYTCAITYDPFFEMARRGKTYGFTIALWEEPATCPSLFRAVDDFRIASNLPSHPAWNALLKSTSPWHLQLYPIRKLLGYLNRPHYSRSGERWNMCHYWSNFEIADLDFFRGDAYQSGPIPRLLDGPRHRTRKTQWQITKDILKLKLKPTFYNAQRAYQGFMAKDEDDAERYFRTIHVPEGPDSLWHSVAYWVQTRDQCYAGDIWKHWVVKGRIWAYFMSVLEDSNHVRWADYHFIQSTEYIRLAPDYGDITLARSLHASPSQGRAAQSPAEIFWVIADYFRTQVVVFYPDEIITPGAIEYRLKPEEINPQNPQGSHDYSYKVYGHYHTDERQILLATSDWKSFDAIDFDIVPQHKTRGYDPDDDHNPDDDDCGDDDGAPTQRHPHFRVPNNPSPPPGGHGTATQARQTSNHTPLDAQGHPMYKQCRFNFYTTDEMQLLRQSFPNGTVNGDLGLIPFYGPRDCHGQFPNRNLHHYALVDQFATNFAAGIDIPGCMFYLPPSDQISSWQVGHTIQVPVPTPWVVRLPPAEAAQVDWAEWRFGADPMCLDFERDVDERFDAWWEKYQGPIPAGEIAGGRQVMEDPYAEPKPEFDVFRQQIRAMWTYLNHVKTLRGRQAKAYILDALRALKICNPKWKIAMRELNMHQNDGFKILDAQQNVVHLRAISVPESPDSLWHSISYWLYRGAPTGAEVDGNLTELPGSGDRSIFHHWQVKARIWTYFMQVLKNPDHPRWAEYHWLEYQSRDKDRDFGTLSMARSLYTSKAQGAPRFAHRHLLWAIADYFNTEVITFGCGRETPKLDVGAFGHRSATSKNSPILLCTDRSHVHYDPVDYDHIPFHDIPPVAPLGSSNDLLQPAANTPAIIPFATIPYEGRLHCPWWPEPNQRANNPNPHYPPLEVLHSGHPPCEEARYNYIAEEEQPRIDTLFSNGTIPVSNQLFVPRWAPRTICGVLPHRLGDFVFDDLILTDDIWDRFRAGLDIPGMMFYVPNEATRQRWENGGRTGLAALLRLLILIMATRILTSLTLISSPYHVGLRDSPIHYNNRVSSGPDYLLRSTDLVSRLKTHSNIPVHQVEIPPVADAFEGEIGRSFEILRCISKAVTAARNQSSFPIVLAGNCCASVGVSAGLCESEDFKNDGELGCVWFDAHGDYNIPDTVLNGYFDSQGIAMMAGECWKALAETIPGFRPFPISRVVHCGMRDVNPLERNRVNASGMGVVWGDHTKKVDFEWGLRKELRERFGEEKDTPTLVHFDLDCVDSSVGKANAYACPGGLFAEDVADCTEAISERTIPVAFTVASFDPYCDGGSSAKQLAGIAVDALVKVVDGLTSQGLLRPK
ncbi:hypothetical protein N0V88_000637 [Collariella sp. IMI 366227]|nr:hypothetical protein N0V88_000637 [Collariella sp. IMI 366227]